MSNHKQQLLTLKKDYESRLQNTQRHLTRDEPVSQDFAEQAVELENEEVVERLDEEAKQELMLVNKAIRKIEEGSYGYCEECDAAISEDRLNALPHAALCIDCATLA